MGEEKKRRGKRSICWRSKDSSNPFVSLSKVSSFLDFNVVEMDSLHVFINANGFLGVSLNPCMIFISNHGFHAFP